MDRSQPLCAQVAVLLALLAISGQGHAADNDFSATVERLGAEHAASIVEVRFVQTAEFAGMVQRLDALVLGLVVSADGMILVPEQLLQPEFEVSDPSASDPTALMTLRLQASDYRVFVNGRSEPLAARYVTRDADRGIAWLKLSASVAPALVRQLMQPVALDQPCTLVPGQRWFGLWRLPARQGGAPNVAPGFVGGRTAFPFPALAVSGPVGAAFDVAGAFCGYVVNITVDPQGFGGQPWQETLMVDADTIKRLTRTAAGVAGAEATP